MSLPAMLVGETVGEILQASQFAREIVVSVHSKAKKQPPSDNPKTPLTQRRKQRLNPENSELHSRRKREKQAKSQSTRPDPNPTLPRSNEPDPASISSLVRENRPVTWRTESHPETGHGRKRRCFFRTHCFTHRPLQITTSSSALSLRSSPETGKRSTNS